MWDRVLLTIAPILAALSWLSTLLILLVLWFMDDRKKYKSTSPDVSFISTIGAVYDEVFIIGASITAFLFVVTLIQFIARHASRAKTRSLPQQPFKWRMWADLVAFLFGTLAVTCLVLLTVYDSIDHETIHWIFTLSFAFLTILCAIFNLVGVSAFRHTGRAIRTSFIMKILFIVLATLVLFAMIGFIYSCSDENGTLTESCNTLHSIAAILEWSLGFLLFIFILTWVIDFAKN